MRKREIWKQPTPFMQLKVLLMALEGDIDNFCKEHLALITKEKLSSRSTEIIAQLHELNYFLEHPQEWQS